MKIYRNDEKNNNIRKDKLLIRFYHLFVCFVVTGIFSLIPYFSIVSFFRYNSNYLNINYICMRFFVKIAYFINIILLRKTIYKTFDVNDLPQNGYFMLFNHVNELEYPYDFYFAKAAPMYDIHATKKLGLLYPAMTTLGIPLYPGKDIKKSIEKIDEYLEVTNILVYPEGERSFSDSPGNYKKGILKLIYEQKRKTIVFYKGGLASLNNNLFYYKSEDIDSVSFSTFEDFYSHIINMTKDYSRSFLQKV